MRKLSMKKKNATRRKPPVATLTIRGLPEMDVKDLIAVGMWIQDLGTSIIYMEKPEDYAKVFTARYNP